MLGLYNNVSLEKVYLKKRLREELNIIKILFSFLKLNLNEKEINTELKSFKFIN